MVSARTGLGFVDVQKKAVNNSSLTLRDDLRSFRVFTNSREEAHAHGWLCQSAILYIVEPPHHMAEIEGEAGTTASTGLGIACLCSFRDWQRHLEKLNASRVFGSKLGNR